MIKYYSILLLGFFCDIVFSEVIKREIIHFKSEAHSLIDFENINLNTFNSYEHWLTQHKKKKLLPNWEVNLREKSLYEVSGRVIACSGLCRNYRGDTYHKLRYRSKIIEGDELRTNKDSYLWVYLYDGTIVKLGPNSSLTIKEINIGMNKNFLHARVNSGNVLWISRVNHKYKEQDKRETDTLFFPLDFKEARTLMLRKKVDENNLFDLLEYPDIFTRVYKRLNYLISENNKVRKQKVTFNYIVLPNGTIKGEDLSIDMIVLMGAETYIKNRKFAELGIEYNNNRSEVSLEMRGYENKEENIIEEGNWYKIGPSGREFEEFEESRDFNLNEFITKRIPSILIARELLFKRNSLFAFKKMSALELGEKYGYRQWEKYKENGIDDLTLRIKFLNEFTRREETQNLVISKAFATKMKERGMKNLTAKFDFTFFRKAITDYAGKREVQGLFLEPIDYKIMNSMKKKYWKILHE